MEFWYAVRVLVRRWYVVIPCLVVVAAVAVVAVGQAAPSYKATGSLVVLRESQPEPSEDGEKAVQINPWQTADYASNLFALLMAQAATDQAFQDGLETAGASDKYTVTGPVDQSATIFIEVEAASQDDALGSYQLVVDALRTDAQRRQEASGAPEVTRMSLVELAVPIRAERQNNAKVIAFIVITGAGILGTLGLTFLVDALLTARGASAGDGTSTPRRSRGRRSGDADAMTSSDGARTDGDADGAGPAGGDVLDGDAGGHGTVRNPMTVDELVDMSDAEELAPAVAASGRRSGSTGTNGSSFRATNGSGRSSGRG